MKKDILRKCIVTKESLTRDKLFRIVKTPEGNLVFDKSNKLNGRGAYIKKELVIKDDKKLKTRFEHTLKIKIDDNEFENLLNLMRNEVHKNE